MMEETTNTSQVTLEKIKFGLRNAMSRSLLDQMTLEIREDIANDSIVRGISFMLVGNHVHTEEYYKPVRSYPATIWEDLKKSFAPKWFLKRHPVNYYTERKQVIVKKYKVCPHLDVPDTSTHIRFLTDSKF